MWTVPAPPSSQDTTPEAIAALPALGRLRRLLALLDAA